MKKIWMCALAALFGMGSNAGAVFLMTVDQPSLSFGPMGEGESSPQTLVCTVQTDNAVEWSIYLSATPLLHSDNQTQFPAANYRYWITSNYPGTEDPALPGTGAVPTSPLAVYTAHSSEYVVNGATYGIGFKVIVNPSQKGGSYTSQITLSLMDNL